MIRNLPLHTWQQLQNMLNFPNINGTLKFVNFLLIQHTLDNIKTQTKIFQKVVWRQKLDIGITQFANNTCQCSFAYSSQKWKCWKTQKLLSLCKNAIGLYPAFDLHPPQVQDMNLSTHPLQIYYIVVWETHNIIFMCW